MKNAIIGYSGFVGSNLLQFYKFDFYYNSKNFKTARGKTFDTIFFCALPSIKYLANRYPEKDIDIIEDIKNTLDTINCKKFILISTIDVYEDSNSKKNEDYILNGNKNHVYGRNRYLFEEYVKTKFTDFYIIRLPALFGKSLKKNIIYDLIHNNQIDKIPINSYFQWYYLEWLKNDIDVILKNKIRICNLFTEPIHTKKIIDIFDKIYSKNYIFNIEYLGDIKLQKKYDITTKYGYLFNQDTKNYIYAEEKILNSLEKYLIFEKLNKKNLCISNICVNNISQLHFSTLLKINGFTKVQIAPTKLINSWEELEDIDLTIFTNNCLEIYSLQSITYTLDHLNIFDLSSQDKLLNHLYKIIDFSEKKNIKLLVFGCPKNRKVLGEKNIKTIRLFIDFFKKIGDYLQDKKLIICLENNSSKYKCNFLNTIDECSKIVKEINKKNIKMMVDLGNAVMENDSWYYISKYMDIIYNIDISHSHMENFSKIHESNEIFNLILKKNNYQKVLNLEMLIKNTDTELEILVKSINNFINIYAE